MYIQLLSHHNHHLLLQIFKMKYNNNLAKCNKPNRICYYCNNLNNKFKNYPKLNKIIILIFMSNHKLILSLSFLECLMKEMNQ